MPLADGQLQIAYEMLAGTPSDPRGLGLLTGELSRRIGQVNALIGQIEIDYNADPIAVTQIEDGIHQAISEADALSALLAARARALETAEDIVDLLS